MWLPRVGDGGGEQGGPRRGLCDEGTVLYPGCSGSYTHQHGCLDDRTRHTDHAYVTFLGLILCYDYVRCHLWWKLGKENTKPLCANFALSVNL